MVDLSYIGEVRNNSKGTEMKIIAARKKSDIDIQFLDNYGYIVKNQTYVNFKRGQIKNPYDITVYGIGYIGDGKHQSWENHLPTKAYNAWLTMLLRCYNKDKQEFHKAYYGKCTVCEEWYNFQTFAEWYEKHEYTVNERLHIDKDILDPTCKRYSPETCMLVPQKINMLFMNKYNKYGLPNGIRKISNGYEARFNATLVGKGNTVEETYEYYAKAKEKRIRELAEEYIEIIPKYIYNALLNYKVDISNDKNYAA